MLDHGNIDQLRQRWDAFADRPFPKGCGGLEINGICITSIDTWAAGCIQTYIKTGRLDSKGISILIKCLDDLNVVMSSLEGEAEVYFSELLGLSDSVLKILGD